jgi:hypothetical protein
VAIPPFTDEGELPVGVHRATLDEVLARFGVGSARRCAVGGRLERIVRTAHGTGHLHRLIIFGSFATEKPEPNDVDVFLLMDDDFDVAHLSGEAKLLFDHAAADAHFGASVFWMRRMAAWEGEQATVEYWQVKRGGEQRGIIEIVEDRP